MPDRRMLGWLAGIAGVSVAALAAGLVMLWISCDLVVQMDAFYRSLGPEGVEDSVFRYWDKVGQNAYYLQSISPMVLLAGVTGAMVLLAVLSRWWETRPPADTSDQDEATAASAG